MKFQPVISDTNSTFEIAGIEPVTTKIHSNIQETNPTGDKQQENQNIYIQLASERDTYRGNTIENQGCLFIYLCGRTYVILYFDPGIFVLVRWSTLSQTSLNKILWFIEQNLYHPRN